MFEVPQELIETNNIKYIQNESLSKHTTWKIGGVADNFIIVGNNEVLSNLLKEINKSNLPWMILGRGSNILFPSTGVKGVVIKLNEEFERVNIEENHIVCGAGTSLVALATIAAKQGLSGLEFAGGIPASVGGAVCMNAGAHGSEISNVLSWAEVINEYGEVKRLRNSDLEFAYRSSVIAGTKMIVTRVGFEMKVSNKDDILSSMIELKKIRLRTQPLKSPCAGSVFKNPIGYKSGQLIEELGLKGLIIGGAQISPLHGNFITNIGNATSDDVEKLIKHIKEESFMKFGVGLELEVKILDSHFRRKIL